MEHFKIKGQVFLKQIGISTWGIVDTNGTEFRPNFMPEQLKTEGANVVVTAKKINEEFSMHMWGEPIEILAFHTLNPFQ